VGQAPHESSDKEDGTARENTTDEEEDGDQGREGPKNYQDGDTMQKHILSSLAVQERGPTDNTLAKEACWHQLIGKCSKGDKCSFSHDREVGVASLKKMQNNLRTRDRPTSTPASLVSGVDTATTMRMRARVNGATAQVLIDPGSVGLPLV